MFVASWCGVTTLETDCSALTFIHVETWHQSISSTLISSTRKLNGEEEEMISKWGNHEVKELYVAIPYSDARVHLSTLPRRSPETSPITWRLCIGINGNPEKLNNAILW